MPGLGSIGGFNGRNDDKDVFYTYTSFNYAPTIFRYEVATKKSSVFRETTIPGFNAGDYEVKQVFFPSKDGTKIPMYLVHRKGLALDGRNPALMYGYGGFNITTGPSFSALRIALLEQGFVYASVNLRGGSEYGEKWHEAGHEAEEAERLRRLHRRGRVADREQVHVGRTGWRSTAGPTAACSSARC